MKIEKQLVVTSETTDEWEILSNILGLSSQIFITTLDKEDIILKAMKEYKGDNFQFKPLEESK